MVHISFQYKDAHSWVVDIICPIEKVSLKKMEREYYVKYEDTWIPITQQEYDSIRKQILGS